MHYPHQQWGCVSGLGLCLVAGSPGIRVHERSVSAQSSTTFSFNGSNALPADPVWVGPTPHCYRGSGLFRAGYVPAV